MHMPLRFSAHGLFGASRSFDPNYHYDAYTDVRAFLYSPDTVAAFVEPWTHLEAGGKSAAEMQEAQTSMKTMLQWLQLYSSDVAHYYHLRVGRTSGGKADRLSQEGDAMQDGIARGMKLLTSALAQVSALLQAKASGKLIIDPGTLQKNTDAATGEVYYAPAPVAAGQAPAQGGASNYLLPIGAALAAYFALK